MLYSVILACLITVAGCGGGDDDNNSKAAGEITCSPTELTFIAAGGELPVNVKSSGEWSAYTSDSWLTVTPQSSMDKVGVLKVKAEANNTYDTNNSNKSFNTNNTYDTNNSRNTKV